MRLRMVWVAFLFVLAGGVAAAATGAVVAGFQNGFLFAYGDFAKNAIVEDGVTHITSAGSRGGGGIVPPQTDLSAYADESPALRLKVAEGNTATDVLAFFSDSAGAKFTYVYPLTGVPVGQWQLVLPEGGASLKLPDRGWLPGQTLLNVAAVSSVQVQGDYGGKALNVYIDRIEMVEPTAQMTEDRQALMAGLEKQAEGQRREAERLERAKQEALRNSPHLPDGPQVVGVYAVAPDILCVAIQAQKVEKAAQVPYVPQPGDEIQGSGGELLVHEDGRIKEGKTQLTVFRTVNGKRVNLGSLAINAKMIWPPETIEGQPLNEVALQEPAAYSISSKDDPAYARAVPPLKVDRKCKPNDLDVGGHYPMRHWLYLKLPHPLQEGKSYVIGLSGVNTRQDQVSYTHDTRKAQTEAIHVTEVGYRPSDPFKRAYVSTWLGTGGALSCDATAFGLLDDATGEQVYEGRLTFGFGPDKPEHLDKEKNYSLTNVYDADFSDFKRPGTYRVRVPGLGVSAPFRIGDDVWADAFKVSMKGMLHQRSGIALGPPLTDYVRPRPMFPGDDDVKAYELDMFTWEGEGAVNGTFKRLLGPNLDASKLKTNPDAWGGYMDAGDWDRYTGHMRTGYLLLELLDLYPDYFEKVKLALPPDEASDNLPDILNEALWGIDIYRRLQRPDGSVCGGINSTGEPRSGETSWEDSELLGVYAPDPESTYHYAACAAKAARNLARYDGALAATFHQSAEKAWKWADANGSRIAAENKREAPTLRMRALAAAELYHLTCDRAYDGAFREAMAAGKAPFDADRDPWFSYALLPDDLADKDLKQKAIDGYRMLGDTAIKFSQGNAFNIATDVPLLPMIPFVGYWSTPGMSLGPGLPRAYYLTGDEKVPGRRGVLLQLLRRRQPHEHDHDDRGRPQLPPRAAPRRQPPLGPGGAQRPHGLRPLRHVPDGAHV